MAVEEGMVLFDEIEKSNVLRTKNIDYIIIKNLLYSYLLPIIKNYTFDIRNYTVNFEIRRI